MLDNDALLYRTLERRCEVSDGSRRQNFAENSEAPRLYCLGIFSADLGGVGLPKRSAFKSLPSMSLSEPATVLRLPSGDAILYFQHCSFNLPRAHLLSAI